MRQVFIARGDEIADTMSFERKLYVIGKQAAHLIRHSEEEEGDAFYLASLSCRTICYKGMLAPEQVEAYFPELTDERVDASIALVHSRFSTNTFPSWERAHPYRYMIHNGEINTLRGNVNWMKVREALLESDLFGDDLKKLLPIIEEDGSDSAVFDNCLEFLHLGGRTLPHALMMMIPEPWEHHESMDGARRAFYEFHGCLMEPWDGPASIAFTDGTMVGATLDRNGLRPSRYYVTKDDRVIMGSEVGVLEVDADNVLHKGRLQPGRMFLVDTEAGRIIADEELKAQVAAEYPYQQWLDEQLVDLHKLAAADHQPVTRSHEELLQRQQAFGFTFEDLRVHLRPMANDALWPIGSMGNDAPLAVLSDRPQLLYNYFKQLFAQVTNPPIDPIREELVTATETTLGPEHNLLQPDASACRQIRLESPVLTDAQMAQLRSLDVPGFRVAVLPMLFDVDRAGGLRDGLDALFAVADQAIDGGANILILSDRDLDDQRAPIPALLATFITSAC